MTTSRRMTRKHQESSEKLSLVAQGINMQRQKKCHQFDKCILMSQRGVNDQLSRLNNKMAARQLQSTAAKATATTTATTTTTTKTKARIRMREQQSASNDNHLNGGKICLGALINKNCCYSLFGSRSIALCLLLAFLATTLLREGGGGGGGQSRGFVAGAKLPDIYWNSSNPIFRIDNTDHIFDVNKKQHDHDQVDLVCPQAASEQQQQHANRSGNVDSQQERYMIYSVSKEEYDTCRLSSSSQARVVAVCDQQQGKPNRPPFTVTFRSFTPQPNGLEFKAGQDYYFITALIGQTQDSQRRFAPCREQNMKVIFKVCCKAESLAVSASAPAGAVDATASAAANLIRAPAAPAAGGFQSMVSASLSPAGRQQASAQVAPRRPAVVTLRPALLQPASQAQKALQLDDYFSKLLPSLNQQQQAQQQPVTVLPIEVLQPASSELPTLVSGGGGEQSPDSERNDIVQNEQQPSTAAAPPPPSSTRRPAPLSPSEPQQPRPGVAFYPFDPLAPPHFYPRRYSPTPLPPTLTMPARQQLELAAPWSLPPLSRPPTQQQQQQQQQSQQHRLQQAVEPSPSRSRTGIYQSAIWSSQYDHHHSAGPPSRDLISSLDPQLASGGGGAPRPPLVAVISAALSGTTFLLLFALGTERRQQRR